MKLLLIEDDRLLGESIKDYLESNGFFVEWIYDEDFIDKFFNFERFDLVILDLMLKFKKGETILKYIKKSTDIPVIISTAKYEISSKEECFILGADDYLVKPYDPKELLLRVNNLLKRSLSGNTFRINDVEIDVVSKIVKKGGKEVKLTAKEWEILYILLKSRNKVVSSNYIINYVWGDEDIGTDSLRTYIKRLRDILGDNSIETFKGRGYKLN